MSNKLFDLEAIELTEKSFIGSVLLHYEMIDLDLVAKLIRPEDFFFLSNKLIWTQCVAQYTDKATIDGNLIIAALSADIPDIGKRIFFAQQEAGSFLHIMEYVAEIRTNGNKRRMADHAQDVLKIAQDDSKSVDEKLQAIENGMQSLSDQTISDGMSHISEIIETETERIYDMIEGKTQYDGIPLGYKALDDIFCGIQPDDLFILAGRPGMGKTAFMCNIMLNIARITKKPVLLFSAEMSEEKIIRRLVAIETGISTHLQRSAKLTANERQLYIKASQKLKELPIFIDDSPGMTTQYIRAQSRKLKRTHGLAIIMVDHLGRLRYPPHTKSDFEAYSHNVQDCKEIAKSLGSPVVLASQLSREVEKRSEKRPIPSDLRQTGRIEEEADIITFLYRDIVYNPGTEFPNACEFIIAKHRDGTDTTAKLSFVKEKTRFTNLQETTVNLNDTVFRKDIDV